MEDSGTQNFSMNACVCGSVRSSVIYEERFSAYRSWAVADLPIQLGASNYEVPFVKRIGNETEILAERAVLTLR